MELSVSGSFRSWVVSAGWLGRVVSPEKVSRFGPGSFRPNLNRDRGRKG